MIKIGLDAGHGMNTPGKRTPSGEREWSFNNKVIKATTDRLNQYENIQVIRLDDASGNNDISLTARTNKANTEKVALVVSFHHNANSGIWGTWGGTETYTYNGSYPETERLAKLIHTRVMTAYGLRDRGLKKADFHMLRATNMPTVLVEGGFMDSSIDILKLRDDNVLRNAGIGVADGIAEYLGLKLKVVVAPTPVPVGELFRVRKSWEDAKSQIGAYGNLESAINLAKERGYNVYNDKGVLVYPLPIAIEPPLTQDELKKIRVLIK